MLPLILGPEHHSLPNQHGHAPQRPVYNGEHPENWLQLCTDNVLLWGRSEGEADHLPLPRLPAQTAARYSEAWGLGYFLCMVETAVQHGQCCRTWFLEEEQQHGRALEGINTAVAHSSHGSNLLLNFWWAFWCLWHSPGTSPAFVSSRCCGVAAAASMCWVRVPLRGACLASALALPMEVVMRCFRKRQKRLWAVCCYLPKEGLSQS